MKAARAGLWLIVLGLTAPNVSAQSVTVTLEVGALAVFGQSEYDDEMDTSTAGGTTTPTLATVSGSTSSGPVGQAYAVATMFVEVMPPTAGGDVLLRFEGHAEAYFYSDMGAGGYADSFASVDPVDPVRISVSDYVWYCASEDFLVSFETLSGRRRGGPSFGRLSPGVYAVSAAVTASAFPGDDFGYQGFQWDLCMEPYCVADLDESGIVDSQDFFIFIEEFLLGDIPFSFADVDLSESVDSTDFFLFIQRFLQGC